MFHFPRPIIPSIHPQILVLGRHHQQVGVVSVMKMVLLVCTRHVYVQNEAVLLNIYTVHMSV